MGVLRYTITRDPAPGNNIGDPNTIETAFQIIDESTAEKGTERDALDGINYEYELDHIKDLVTVQSDIVEQSEFEQWREFTKSVQGREQFTIDLTGTIAAPGTDLSCKVERNAGFNPRRAQPGVQLYTFTFTVRLL